MTQEKYFPVGDDEVLGLHYVSAAINMTMLRDHCQAEPFLRQIAADEPDFAPELSRALDCYTEVRRIRDGMDALIGDNFSEQAMKAITVAETRGAYADAILHIRDAEAEAMHHLSQLLERCG
jgi:hypothetical protein